MLCPSSSQPALDTPLRQPLCENLVRDFGPRPSTCGWRCSRVVEEKRQGWAACRPARGAGVARSRGRDQLLVATHRSWSCRLEPGAGSGQDPRAAGSRELWAGSGKESSAAGCLRQLATTFSVPHCTGPSHERRCFFHAGSCAGLATDVVHQIRSFRIALLQKRDAPGSPQT